MAAVDEAELCFPQLLNSLCKKIRRAPSVSLLLLVSLSSVSVVTVCLNLLVIVAIAHFRRLHSATNLLLLSLAVSDCMVGFLISFQIIFIDGCWFLGDVMCALYVLLDYAITAASIGTMVLISVDRYVAICCPLQYPAQVTPGRVKVCVCVCWLCAFVCHGLILKDSLQAPGRYRSCVGECVLVLSPAAGLADLVLSFVGPVAAILVLYGRVFVVAISQARAVGAQVGAVTSRRSEAKAAVTLGVVVVVFLLCTCPYFCVMMSDAALSASSVTFLLFYFNSTLNPLIYALFYPWFRKSVRVILTLRILQPGSCDTVML